MADKSPEQKKEYHVSKAFKGVNTKANRTAIDENEFSWLENAMPIGSSNIKIVPAQSTVSNGGGINVAWNSAVNGLYSVNVNLNDYILAFEQNGGAEYYNLTTQVKGNIAVAGTFSNANVTVSQWKDERVLILDPSKGLYSWDSNSTVAVGSVGFIGIVNGGSGFTGNPTITISGPDDTNGQRANAQAVVSNSVVTGVLLIDAGYGYTNAANLTVTISGGGGTGAQAVASILTFATGTVTYLVTNPGSGYTNASNITVTVTGGGGTGAAAKAITSGNQISQLVVTNPGSGYSNSANTVVAITGGGGSNATAQAIVNTQPNVDLAAFSGRNWVAFGRTVAYSAAGTFNDFVSASAGSFTINDDTLHSSIQGLLPANNFLYVFGPDSINVFSDVQVNGTTGATVFTNTNISASIGSKLPYAWFPYFRSILFMNTYGVYALVGATTTKLSDPLDGIFPLIDFTQPVTGGQVLINNILCAAFSFTYLDPINGSRPIQAVFFEKKWFFTSQGTIKYVTSVPFGGNINLYGTSGNNLVQMYVNSTTNISSTIQTALNEMGDPIRDKQAIRYGIEATLTNIASVSVTIDSEKGSANASAQGQTNFVQLLNNNNLVIPVVNNSNAVVSLIGNYGYSLYTGDAQQWGKYLGMTVTSNSPAFTINTFEYEHELRARF